MVGATRSLEGADQPDRSRGMAGQGFRTAAFFDPALLLIEGLGCVVAINQIKMQEGDIFFFKIRFHSVQQAASDAFPLMIGVDITGPYVASGIDP